jgi:hypothetical protein
MSSMLSTRSWRLLLHLLTWHLAFVRQRLGWLLLAAIFHFLFGLLNGEQAAALSLAATVPLPHIGDGLFLAFSGPSLGNSSLIPLLAWLLNMVFFCC